MAVFDPPGVDDQAPVREEVREEVTLKVEENDPHLVGVGESEGLDVWEEEWETELDTRADLLPVPLWLTLPEAVSIPVSENKADPVMELVDDLLGVGVKVLLRLPLPEAHSDGSPVELPAFVALGGRVPVPVVQAHCVGVRLEVGRRETEGVQVTPRLELASDDAEAHPEADALPLDVTEEISEEVEHVVGEAQGLAVPLTEPRNDTLGVVLPRKVLEAAADREAGPGLPLSPHGVLATKVVLEAVEPRVSESLGDLEGVRVLVAVVQVLREKAPEGDTLELPEGHWEPLPEGVLETEALGVSVAHPEEEALTE